MEYNLIRMSIKQPSLKRHNEQQINLSNDNFQPQSRRQVLERVIEEMVKSF